MFHQQIPRIGISIALYLAFIGHAVAFDHRYKAEKDLYDSCKPRGVGDIEKRDDAHIEFFFLADIERCENKNNVVIQHVVKNPHKRDKLVFEWKTGDGKISQKDRRGLPPGKHHLYELVANSYDEEEDHDAYIRYGNDLRRIMPATRWTERAKRPDRLILTNYLISVYLL